jgi:alpha-L-rhamnosidase
LFPVKNGATTVWERWDGWTSDKGFQDIGMNSFNHYAYGAVGAWMYRTVAGLELDPAEPGYRHINQADKYSDIECLSAVPSPLKNITTYSCLVNIIFRPRPGGTITWAEASLDTPQGHTAIKWELQDDTLTVSLTVPVNAQATFSPPPGFAAETAEFGSGVHTLMLKRQ